MHSDETSASLFYKKTFKKPIQEFTAEANLYWFKSNTGNDFTNITYLYNTDSQVSTYSRIEDDLNQQELFLFKIELCPAARNVCEN